MTAVAAPAPRRRRRWMIGLVVAGLLAVTAPVWGQVFLILTIAVADELAQRTTEYDHPPGTMPLVGPGREAKTIVRGGPCYMCTTGRRGTTYWGSSLRTATPLYMVDREAYALLPPAEPPRSLHVVALEPMVVLVRNDPDEVAPEGGFPPSEGYKLIHGGKTRFWHGPSLPGTIEGLAWASPGVPLTPVPAAGGTATLPLPNGRLVLTEAEGRVIVTRE